jgi:hypothetical protein
MDELGAELIFMALHVNGYSNNNQISSLWGQGVLAITSNVSIIISHDSFQFFLKNRPANNTGIIKCQPTCSLYSFL